MERPHIICHMETSINGKTTGPFMGMPQRAALARAHDESHPSFGSQAWLCGRVTMAHFAGNAAPEFSRQAPHVPRADHGVDLTAVVVLPAAAVRGEHDDPNAKCRPHRLHPLLAED